MLATKFRSGPKCAPNKCPWHEAALTAARMAALGPTGDAACNGYGFALWPDEGPVKDVEVQRTAAVQVAAWISLVF